MCRNKPYLCFDAVVAMGKPPADSAKSGGDSSSASSKTKEQKKPEEVAASGGGDDAIVPVDAEEKAKRQRELEAKKREEDAKKPEEVAASGGGDGAIVPVDAEEEAKRQREVEVKKREEDAKKREELKAAVAKFDKAKWDEIARWMQSHRYFDRHVRQSRLHVRLPGANITSVTVQQWVSGKALRKIVSSKDFVEKFGLTFAKSHAEILLVAMHNREAAKLDMTKNFGRTYFLQVQFPTQSDKKEMILAKPSSDEIVPDAPYVCTFCSLVHLCLQ